MTRRKPRGLRPEEEELWAKVRENATALHPSKRQIIKAAIERPKKVIEPQPRISQFRIGQRATATSAAHNLAPSISDRVNSAPIQMDHKSFGKMKRGKLSPAARIDLHGMTIAQAHPALNRFILDAHSSGLRLVLVITGKGKHRDDGGPIPVRTGVLKHQVPTWLQSGPLRPAVMQVTEAHIKHGGSGAYYVYLRRIR